MIKIVICKAFNFGALSIRLQWFWHHSFITNSNYGCDMIPEARPATYTVSITARSAIIKPN